MKELAKLSIEKVNTPACEQAFAWINNFKNLKTMNEARFKFFLLYMIDLHNLHIDNNVGVIANPMNRTSRETLTSKKDTPYQQKESEKNDKIDTLLVDFSQGMKLDEVFEDFFNVDKSGQMICRLCPGIYKREGHMRNHLETKHNKMFKIICNICKSTYPDSARLSRHKKNCKSK